MTPNDLEQFRLDTLERVPDDILETLPIHRTVLAEPGPRLVVDFGYHEWRLWPKSTKQPATWSLDRAVSDPLYALGHLVELGVPLHTVRVRTGFFEKPKRDDKKSLGRHPSVPSLPGVSLRGMSLAKATELVAPALTNATRLNLDQAKADVAALARHDWPNLEYLGLNRAVGDAAAFQSLLARTPVLRGAAVPSAALSADTTTRVRQFDYLDLHVTEADHLSAAEDWISDNRAHLGHLRIEGWVRDGASTASLLGDLPALRTLVLTAVSEPQLPRTLTLPSLRALALTAYSPAVLEWLARQPWLAQLEALDLDARSAADVPALAHVVQTVLASDTTALRVEAPSSRPTLADLVGDASSDALTTLELRGVSATPACLSGLATAFPNLQHLAIHTTLSTNEVAALATFEQHLTHLGIVGKLKREAFGALLQLPLTETVQTLDLPNTRLDDHHLRLLVDTTIPQLLHLYLGTTRANPDTLAAALNPTNKPRLAALSGLSRHNDTPHRLRTQRPCHTSVLHPAFNSPYA